MAVDGAGVRHDKLFAGKRKASLTSEDYEKILTTGAGMIQKGAQSIVARRARKRTGKLEQAISFTLYPSIRCPMAILGWREDALSKSKKSSYVDGRGRKREVATVADYARILEYSDKRQLRHMEAAQAMCESAALDAMEKEADALMGRLADAFEQETF